MKRYLPVTLGATFLLTACVDINITKDHVLITNEVAEKNHIKFGNKLEPKDAAIKITHTTEVGVMPLSFGNITYNYIKSERDVPLVVFCGGNGFRLNYGGAFHAPSLFDIGDVVMFDYPGMGESGGDGRRPQFTETLTAMNKKITEISLARANHKIIYYGHSFGGGVCSSLVNKDPNAAAVVLVATFADYPDVAASLKPVLSKFAHLKIDENTPEFKIPPLLAGYKNPVFVIASKTDDTIKYPVSEKLYNKLSKQGQIVQFIALENAAHSKVPSDEELQPKLKTALEQAGIK